MASDDVIELGSSDDEQIPPPCKPKPRPNAMVHIPKSSPGFSSNIRKKVPLNGNVGNTSKNAKKLLPNPFSPLNRVQNLAHMKFVKTLPASELFKAAITNNLTSTKKVNIPTLHNISVKNAHLVQKCTQSQREEKAQCLDKLPPGITVTRTGNNVLAGRKIYFVDRKTGVVDRKRPMPQTMCNTVVLKKSKLQNTVLQNKALQNKVLQNKPLPNKALQNKILQNKTLQNKALHNKALQNEILQNKALHNKALQNKALQTETLQNKALQNKSLHKVGAVLTIEVDKDDNITCAPTVVRPEWYVKPEDYQKAEDIEKQNNKEPQPIKYVEITIEDSPIKSLPDKRVLEMGVETPIVIEDSPAKPSIKKNIDGSCTDNEDDKNDKIPHSKKRLDYPNDDIPKNALLPKRNDENKDNDTTVKKAIITQETVSVNNETIVLEDDEVPQLVQNNITIEIDSPIKCLNDTKKNNMLEVTGEFHPFYQKFIDLCFKLEDSDDMHKIVEKKLKAYYRQVPKSYVESEGFLEMVSSKITAMEITPERMYLHIKDIVDEMNFQRKNSKSQTTDAPRESSETVEAEVVPLSEDGEVDTKKQNQIRKLEKVLNKLHKAIQKLEEQEVNFDDDADSVYLLTDRYKERLMRVHKKICQLTNTKMPSDPRVRVEARAGRPNGPARKVEDLINKKGGTKSFPDFHDVLRCVKEANNEENLGWNDVDIMEEARDLFTRCGKKLQRRRQENDWRIASYRLDDTVDPAEQSEELKTKLERNARIAAEKESALINRYADRQNQLKLEAVEIGDKEAEESPIESDDEVEIIDENVPKINEDIVSSDKNEDSSNNSPVIIHKETKDIECVVSKTTSTNINVNEDNATNDPPSLDDNTLLVPIQIHVTDILESDSGSDNASECLDLGYDNDDKLNPEVVSIEDSSSDEENVTPRQSGDSNTMSLTTEKIIGNNQNVEVLQFSNTLDKIDEDAENNCIESSTDINGHKSKTPEKSIGYDQNVVDMKHSNQETFNNIDEHTEKRFIESSTDINHHKSKTPEKSIGNDQNLEHMKQSNVNESVENEDTEPSDKNQDHETVTNENFDLNSVEIVSLEDTQSPKDTTDTIFDDIILRICSKEDDDTCINDKIESDSEKDINTPLCQIEDIKSCADCENTNGNSNNEEGDVESNTMVQKTTSIDNVEHELEKMFNS